MNSFCSDAAPGDIATVGECRKLAKTVHFNVLKVYKTPAARKMFDKF